MDRDELEGYLVGVARRLEELEVAEPPLTAALAEARRSLRAGRLADADRQLRAIDAALDRRRPEMEMLDRPRGLVGYTPKGDRGVPPGPEEEPLQNRLRLVGRLASLREAEGHEVGEARRLLTEAQRAYDAGDRATARRRVDDAHRILDPTGREPRGTR